MNSAAAKHLLRLPRSRALSARSDHRDVMSRPLYARFFSTIDDKGGDDMEQNTPTQPQQPLLEQQPRKQHQRRKQQQQQQRYAGRSPSDKRGGTNEQSTSPFMAQKRKDVKFVAHPAKQGEEANVASQAQAPQWLHSKQQEGKTHVGDNRSRGGRVGRWGSGGGRSPGPG